MLVDLNREDLLNMLRGTSPNLEDMHKPPFDRCGSYSASYDTWQWGGEGLDDLTDDDILAMYMMCMDR